MIEIYENLDWLVEYFRNLIYQMGKTISPEYKMILAGDICQASRMVRMRTDIAIYNGEIFWKKDKSIGKRVIDSMQMAIQACEGTRYEKNIADRLRAICEAIRNQPLR